MPRRTPTSRLALRIAWAALASLALPAAAAPADSQGRTPLVAAIAAGDARQAGALLKGPAAKGAALARTREGRTLMHYARGTQVILLLLDAGLDANARDAAGRTPLHALAIELAERGAKGPADLAPRELETIQALVAVGANVDARDDNGQAPRDFWPPLAEVAARR